MSLLGSSGYSTLPSYIINFLNVNESLEEDKNFLPLKVCTAYLSLITCYHGKFQIMHNYFLRRLRISSYGRDD